MPNWTSARGRATRHSARGLLFATLASALLAGCGSSSKDQELEARIAAAEAKADAADKRSQQALSMAASGSSSGQFAPEPENVVGDSGVDDSMLTDNSGENGAFDNVIEAPQIPPG
ncbi:outer membrane murein-binding lipoprotein Lpp [Novosphingobium hassiacum]|uniref:Outer membrane murein-binding lipoprotein Lpp n=1 Tax=Novosphingobium hassiacum TaxID=173676 RepID=A0A7W6EWI4_9SPHN|nr:hypothetical protein [Novosphingobium hassiacum]MBB3861050.1 outer membrane murein-binding lipoprotein Lpp [Novosphingobium hassiacum]